MNANRGSGPVNTNWGPEPGSGAKQRAEGWEIPIPLSKYVKLLGSFVYTVV